MLIAAMVVWHVSFFTHLLTVTGIEVSEICIR